MIKVVCGSNGKNCGFHLDASQSLGPASKHCARDATDLSYKDHELWEPEDVRVPVRSVRDSSSDA